MVVSVAGGCVEGANDIEEETTPFGKNEALPSNVVLLLGFWFPFSIFVLSDGEDVIEFATW